ncbi:hypothetical protein SCLCIDRAFT_1207839 [Scleroderma citrinum Foug A]|uniref:SMP-30/Gluconolactonase/LRE-like region domain-containing protein n=1 Tax=Scleroderma citrinum Foug A TaxID=1036808 RepID=A0A0C3E9K9_9AGAM|nr:hypothetical protein SCLCIDRAFT_1207839 [Scleroderma citrinum Foug A]
MVPIHTYTLPDDVTSSLVVSYGSKCAPRHLGSDSNGDLYVAATGPACTVLIMIRV